MGKTFSSALGYEVDEEDYERQGLGAQSSGDSSSDDRDVTPAYVPPATMQQLAPYQGSQGPIDIRAGLDPANIEQSLRDAAAQFGVGFDQSDLEGILRNTGYNVGGISLEEAFRNQLDTYAERGINTPGEDRSDRPDLPGEETGLRWWGTGPHPPGFPGVPGTPGTPGGGPSFGSGPGNTNNPNTPVDLTELMNLLKNINFEEGLEVNLPGPGELPTIEVPGVNLNNDIDNAILSLLRGNDATTMQTNSAIQRLLASVSGDQGSQQFMGMGTPMPRSLSATAQPSNGMAYNPEQYDWTGAPRGGRGNAPPNKGSAVEPATYPWEGLAMEGGTPSWDASTGLYRRFNETNGPNDDPYTYYNPDGTPFTGDIRAKFAEFNTSGDRIGVDPREMDGSFDEVFAGGPGGFDEQAGAVQYGPDGEPLDVFAGGPGGFDETGADPDASQPIRAMGIEPERPREYRQPDGTVVFGIPPARGAAPQTDWQGNPIDQFASGDPDLLQSIASAAPSASGTGINVPRLTQRNLQSAERAHLAQQGLLDQLRGSLADAGTLSLPGIQQGAETAGARRTAERVAIPFAQELRENAIRESELADEREINALTLATGWSEQQAQRVLSAAAVGTDRQRILSEVALGTLDRNITWNKFLFDAGIRREELAESIRAGRMDRVGAILQSFQQFLSQLRGGYIGQ